MKMKLTTIEKILILPIYYLFKFIWEKLVEYLTNSKTLNFRLTEDEEMWWKLDGWQFEQEVAKVFRLQGYKARVTKGSGDDGVDIVLNKGGKVIIVQCKHYINKVTPEPIRALWGVKDEFNADEVVLVASSGVTKSGQNFIDKRSKFKLLTLQDIIEILRTYK